MQKSILCLCSIIIAISLFFTAAVPVMADNGKNQELTQSNKAELIIRMMDKVDVGQTVAITVYTKYDHNTVSQAMVYALNISQLIITADNADYNTTSESYADVAAREGLFLGYTGNDGKLDYTFQDTGRYIIIVVKDGFIPVFNKISILGMVNGSLLLRVQDEANVNVPVFMSAVDRATSDNISDVDIYA